MGSFQRLSIGRQLLLVTVLATATVFIALVLIVNRIAESSAIKQADEALQRDLSLLSSFLDYTYQTQVTTARRRMNAFTKLLPGKLTVAKTTMRTGDADDVPVVKAGSEVMNNNAQLLESLKQINTAEGFILAKRGGDYVRVATLLKDASGKSQVGQALKPDEPQVAALNRGEGYIGVILRNGKSYMSIYEPVRDDEGKVVGAYGLRSSLETDLAALREVVAKQKVGKTGYYFAFVDAGKDVGLLTIHPTKQGKTLAEVFSGKPEVLQMFAGIMKDKGGTMMYPWPNAAKGGSPETKMTVFSYSKEWGWYFGAGTFLDELTEDALYLRNVLVIAALVAAVFIGFAIHWGISSRLRPLGAIVSGLSAIGEGRLSARVPAAPEASQNELDILANQLNATSVAMQGLVTSIADTSLQLGSASTQLDEASSQVAVAAQQQSDTAANMAASIEEFSVSVSQVADLAREASDITSHEFSAADSGEHIVVEVTREMQVLAQSVKESGALVESLDKRSVEIEGIVRLIREVAEQTNLLALNAAIEAARAGEAGRGFAVVADEVRKLAERTSQATGDISQVIGGIRSETRLAVEKMRVVVGGVQEGVANVDKAGAALEDIRKQSEHSAGVVSEIAAATHEQSVAGNEVARKLEAVAQMAEETSATTQSNREAAANLGELSRKLNRLVERFEV